MHESMYGGEEIVLHPVADEGLKQLSRPRVYTSFLLALCT